MSWNFFKVVYRDPSPIEAKSVMISSFLWRLSPDQCEFLWAFWTATIIYKSTTKCTTQKGGRSLTFHSCSAKSDQVHLDQVLPPQGRSLRQRLTTIPHSRVLTQCHGKVAMLPHGKSLCDSINVQATDQSVPPKMPSSLSHLAWLYLERWV